MVDREFENPSRPSRWLAPVASRWLAPVATTLGGWLVAFLVVTALLTVFGDELKSLPLALRALVISGVLVALMVNVVMPLLGIAVARWLGRSPRTRQPGRGSHGAEITGSNPGADPTL